MAGLRCDISAEVDECARQLKEHFESILQGAAAHTLVDVREIEDILRSALPLEELFALREAFIRAVCGREN